jgi:hypothetical protein
MQAPISNNLTCQDPKVGRSFFTVDDHYTSKLGIFNVFGGTFILFSIELAWSRAQLLYAIIDITFVYGDKCNEY